MGERGGLQSLPTISFQSHARYNQPQAVEITDLSGHVNGTVDGCNGRVADVELGQELEEEGTGPRQAVLGQLFGQGVESILHQFEDPLMTGGGGGGVLSISLSLEDPLMTGGGQWSGSYMF